MKLPRFLDHEPGTLLLCSVDCLLLALACWMAIAPVRQGLTIGFTTTITLYAGHGYTDRVLVPEYHRLLAPLLTAMVAASFSWVGLYAENQE